MSRAPNSALRQEQIVEAMIRVVARVGYERASVQEIARAAGLAPGLVHYHFRRKLDVLLAVQEALVARHLARVERWMAGAAEGEARVGAFVDCHLARGAEEDPDALACWIALTAEALREPEVRVGHDRAVRAMVASLEGAVRDALRARMRDAGEAAAIATAVFASIQGYYALHGASPGLIPRGSAAPAVHRLTRALLAGDATGLASPETPGSNR